MAQPLTILGTKSLHGTLVKEYSLKSGSLDKPFKSLMAAVISFTSARKKRHLLTSTVSERTDSRILRGSTDMTDIIFE